MIGLPPGEVHVWSAALDLPVGPTAEFRSLLTDEERRRADRFVQARDQRRFTAGRGWLRVILGAYLGQGPESIRFTHGPHGKPGLDASPLRFNVSHSGNVLLVALTFDRELGVDVEQIRPDFGGEAIARRFFAPEEVDLLLSLPFEDRTLAFFQGWTRKEAYIKAHGKGLAMPLDEFAVEIRPGNPAALIATRPDPLEAGRWTLVELAVPPGFVAALCVAGDGWTVQHREWVDR